MKSNMATRMMTTICMSSILRWLTISKVNMKASTCSDIMKTTLMVNNKMITIKKKDWMAPSWIQVPSIQRVTIIPQNLMKMMINLLENLMVVMTMTMMIVKRFAHRIKTTRISNPWMTLRIVDFDNRVNNGQMIIRLVLIMIQKYTRVVKLIKMKMIKLTKMKMMRILGCIMIYILGCNLNNWYLLDLLHLTLFQVEGAILNMTTTKKMMVMMKTKIR